MDNQGHQDIDHKAIGERIRKQRMKCGLTQEKLAETIGFSPIYIGQLERQMSLSALYRMTECFHISTDYLINGTESCQKGDTKEIFSLINRCSEKEISVIEDVIKVILPHIKR